MNSEKLNELIDSLAKDFAPEVVKIESGIKTTQNNYGKYMGLISMLSKNSQMAKIMALALIKAGANSQGVASALQVLGYS